MDNIITANRGFKPSVRVKPLSLSNYQMLFWLFMTGSVVGFVLEGLWMIIKAGHWENHSAVIWGPFCIIYGIGAAAAFLLSQIFSGRHVLLQFGACFISGTLVEYFGSLFQEFFFGTISWDYSEHFLNIGGRVSLKMALVWGIFGVLFMRFLFPLLNRVFEKLNRKKGTLLCRILMVFMVLNLATTSVVLTRWHRRQENILPGNSIERAIDYIYGDEKMERLYPNMRFIDFG